MKLMYSPTSPFVRRVRAVAFELGLADRISLEAVTVAPGRENEEFAATINPLRKIPALVLDDGAVLIDSSVICAYLDSLAGGGRVIPITAPEEWQVLSQQAIADGMTDALVLARYEVALRPQPLRWPQWLEDQQSRFWTGLAWFERIAATALDSRGGACDVSQIALACCLGYADFRFEGFDWPARAPRVSAWYREFMQRPSMSNTAPA
ncbi:MAG TPA: glutathione S-transferase family protein [Steroidobacteraceae bacterium]|jgi:glutathione S-transferase